MASTNVDGSNMMILNEGSTVSLIIGHRTYLGTLHMRTVPGFLREDWYIKLTAVEPGEPDEIQIYKVEKEGE